MQCRMTFRSLALLASALILSAPAHPAFADSAAETELQQRIETGLIPLVTFQGEEDKRLSIEERRAELGVPAVSVAVLRGGEIGWARAYGEGANPDTLFQFASLSKPVAAAGIIAFAFEQGVGVDDDISDQLGGLDLDRLNPDGLPITLRGLLSHTNGATVSGFRGYNSMMPIPTTAQVIEGTAPTNSDPVVIKPNPDRERRYSGGGYTVAQYWVERVSGQPFEGVMRRLVLDPLGMERSTFASTPPAMFSRGNVADGWARGKMLVGNWMVHPEQAAASLWSTPREYLLFLRALMRALDGDASSGISPEVARAMTSPVTATYGLGIGIAKIDGAIRLNHSGSNIGYKSNFMAYPATGDAIVTVTNSESGWAMVGDVGRTANVTYGWPVSPLPVRTRLPATAEDFAAFTGEYTEKGGDTGVFTLTAEGTEMVGKAPSGYTFRLIKTGEATFIDPQDGQEGTFVTDADGQVSVTFGGTTYVRVGAGE